MNPRIKMNKHPVAIIEDEKRNQELLEIMISKHCPQLEIVGFAENVYEAISLIKRTKPDLIFLDIQLKGGTGFEVLNHFQEAERPNIIFTTAFDQYALEAFKYSAVNYLLKPIDKTELIDSVSKAIEIKKMEQMSSVSVLLDRMMDQPKEQMISISGTKTTEYIKVSDIIHIHAMGSYSKIVLANGESHLVSKVIKFYAEMLSQHNFFRVHQSHLINLKSVRKFNKGDHTVELENGDEVSVSRNRKDEFLVAMDTMIL